MVQISFIDSIKIFISHPNVLFLIELAAGRVGLTVVISGYRIIL